MKISAMPVPRKGGHPYAVHWGTEDIQRTGSGKVMENLPRATRVQSAIDQSVCTMYHRATVNHLAESMIQLSRG